MFYLVLDNHQNNFGLWESRIEKMTPRGYSYFSNNGFWSPSLQPSRLLKATFDEEDSTPEWIDDWAGITLLKAFNSLEEYDQYVDAHPELQL